MWDAVSNFLSCQTNKKRKPLYETNIVYPTQLPSQQSQRGTLSARGVEEMEPMIGSKPSLEGRSMQSSSGSSRGCIICCCCCGCISAALVALLVLLAFVTSTTNVEVEDTRFDFWNYYGPQFRYILAGRADTYSWSKWYKELASKRAPMEAEGPGPNTRTYYGWQAVKERLEEFAARIRDGTLRRHNELGLMLLNDGLWPESGSAVTGFTSGDHATVRPYLASSLDGAEGPWDKNCNGSSCWNEAWLRSAFKERFKKLDAFSREDLGWILADVLHKVQLDLELSGDELKDFASMQQKLIQAAPFHSNWFFDHALGVESVLAAKQSYQEKYKDAIKKKWPKEHWDKLPGKLEVLASAMVDSLALIGGSTLPTALDFLLSLNFMDGEPGRSIRPLNMGNDAQLTNFIWETLRRYPPMTAVPRWVVNDSQSNWKREILSLYEALHDPTFFPDPLEYRLGRPGLNHEDSTLSVGFADMAVVNGDVSDPNSHSCPAKQLTFRLLSAFLREFEAAGPWKADSGAIALNSYGSSGFVLRKGA